MAGCAFILFEVFAGEAGSSVIGLDAWIGFAFGMAGWAFILFKVFAGEAGSSVSSVMGVGAGTQPTQDTMREYWVQMHRSPVVYRFIAWSITGA